MNEQIKQEWIAALRSEKYTQGQGRLRTSKEDGQSDHCCLGVLCDLYAQSHMNSRWKPNDDFEIDPDPSNEYPSSKHAYFLLPEKVSDWAKIEDEDMKMLISHNDATPHRINELVDKYTFEHIAQLIEDYL